MSVSNVSSATQSYGAAETASRIPTQALQQEDFLKLLVTQLTSQDPLNPQSDVDFISQMTQFSSLESSQNILKEMSALREDEKLAQANTMLGRTVSLGGADGKVVRGEVAGVTIDGGAAKILVNGQFYDLSQVLSISPAQGPR